MTVADYDASEVRVEFHDSESGLAWVAGRSSSPGERCHARLAQLLARIAIARGAPIACFGRTGLRLSDAAAGPLQFLLPDQLVRLHECPEELRLSEAGLEPGPEVVLETDHVTDLRGYRLELHEEWRFPEVWIEVPDAYSPSRSVTPGLGIHLLEGERFVRSPESRAFPGWQATEIHRALNERLLSPETDAVLYRVGRMLGEAEGTDSDEDPWLGGFARQRFAEGRAQGRTEAALAVARALLRQRGIELPAAPPPAALRGAAPETLVRAATAATSLADFLARLGAPNP